MADNSQPPGTSLDVGARHERVAAKHLENLGLAIITRNFRCKLGEIDIIAERGRKPQLHFVEVRYRRSERFGGAAASVTRHKQIKVRRCAEVFLLQSPHFRSHRCQFDVVTLSGTNYPYSIEWIEDAF